MLNPDLKWKRFSFIWFNYVKISVLRNLWLSDNKSIKQKKKLTDKSICTTIFSCNCGWWSISCRGISIDFFLIFGFSHLLSIIVTVGWCLFLTVYGQKEGYILELTAQLHPTLVTRPSQGNVSARFSSKCNANFEETQKKTFPSIGVN